MLMRSWFAIAATGLALALAPAAAQGQDPTIEGRGHIQGRVVDGTTGAPLPHARVGPEGMADLAQTDLNGRYFIRSLPTGVYRVSVRLIGYTPKTVTNVTVSTGETLDLDVTLTRSVVQLDAIEVSAEVEYGSAIALIEDRRGAAVVTNSIGAEEMSRSPDSDAAEALKRVTGMSVVGDRYVYVRGLGDRYSGARLNGAPLPSPEPDRKAIPLDLFPSNLLESVVASKTYSPDQPGDYSGGLVDIRTKDFPGGRNVKFSASVGMNTRTSFKSGLGYRGGGLDYLAFDDGTRAIPDAVPSDVKLIDALVGDQQLQDIGRSFSSVWEPRTRDVPINESFSASLADETRLLGLNVGFVGAATYANSYTSADLVERVLVSADQDERPETDYAGEITERTVRWSLFGKTDILLSPTNQFTVRSLYTRTADDQARRLAGYNRDRNNSLLNYRLRFISRSLWSNTIEGDHLIEGLGGTRFQWRAGYARATSDEPDRREVVYDEISEGRYVWRELTNSGTRYFTELSDRDLSGSADIIVPLGGYAGRQFKFGGMLLEKERDFFTRRFRYRQRGPLGEATEQSPDVLFSESNIAPDRLELEEDTRRTDNYLGEQSSQAAYMMLDLPFGDLRISGGARVEHVRQTVDPFDLFPLPGLAPVDSAVIDNTDLLPGVNIAWSMSDVVSLRAAFSRTVARPEFREQAPFDFVDYAGGYLVVGNPALERSAIFNYDLRWEWFPRPTSLFAISGFYKSFDGPIEAVVFPSSELIATWANNRTAEVYGAEMEMRTGLAFVAPPFANFSLGANVTLVHSMVASADSVSLPGGSVIAIEPRDRALQGQSPYVINGSLTYFHPTAGSTVTVLYNRFGRRIDKVGTQVLPDVFEEPRDQLDFVIQQGLWAGASLKFTASNLLDANAEFTQADQLVRSATRGRSFSLGISIGTDGS